MIFQNRQGSNLNRKRLRIVSQTAEEIIADVERADNPTVEGTPINASTMNQLQSEIDTANSNASGAVTTADAAYAKALYVESQLADRGATVKFNGVTQSEVNFDSDPQTQINGKLSIANVLSVTYPVGAIYLSVNSTNPGTLFGGTWEQIQDRFLLAAGSVYTAGTTGGEANHTLTTTEMPSHTHNNTIDVSASQQSHMHSIPSGTGKCGNAAGLGYAWNYGVGGCDNDTTSRSNLTSTPQGVSVMNSTAPTITVTKSITNASAGSGQAHNNMPPYLTVYMWKRIS